MFIGLPERSAAGWQDILRHPVGSGRSSSRWINSFLHPINPFPKSVDSAPLDDELFDMPQASLTAVPLHEAFSWAYAHFILEDEVPISLSEPRSLTRPVLRYAATAA